MNLTIRPASAIPKFRQIADHVDSLITSGSLSIGEKLPSIDTVSQQTGVARQTVVQAYSYLKKQGMIDSSRTRGFYVRSTISHRLKRVLVLFNVMSPSKENIYHSILNELKGRAEVELLFYNYNFEIFENIVRSKAGLYHHYIIMPPHQPAALKVLQVIPPRQLVLIDRPVAHCPPGASSVHQDFELDIYDALSSEITRLRHYRQVVLLFPRQKNLPAAIRSGLKKFGIEHHMPVKIAAATDKKLLLRGTLFITVTDELLITLLEMMEKLNLRPGKDIGLISYNDSPLKRILAGGISTLSSDFEAMGRAAARCILENKMLQARNPFKLIVRNSLLKTHTQ